MSEPRSPHRIHRYTGNRLVDTVGGERIDREQIRQLVRAGESVEVIDTKTGEDCTAEILVDICRWNPHLLPVKLLEALLRCGDESQVLRRSWIHNKPAAK